MEAKVRAVANCLGWNINSSGNFDYVVGGHLQLNSFELDILSELVEKYKSDSDSVKHFMEFIRKHCIEKSILLERASAEKTAELLEREFNSFGPLSFLLDDDNLEEVSVIGLNKPIRVYHKEKGWLSTNLQFSDEKAAINAINKMSRALGRRITTQTPRINATLPNGERLHASIPPISQEVEITIRKFKSNPLTPIDLMKNKTISAEALAFLWTVLFADTSILIAGNTGSGKTSTLNALFSFIPLKDRIIIAEETPELNIPHEHTVKVLASEELQISMKDLIQDTLRMRPDRQVVGEVRNQQEVEALFECLLAGQARGTMATFHAQTGEDALKRLVAMGVKKEDVKAIDLILIQRRIPIMEFANGKTISREIRRVTEISEVNESGEINKIFAYNPGKDELEKTGNNSNILEKTGRNYKLKPGETIQTLVCNRIKKLEKSSRENASLKDFAVKIQTVN